MKKLYIDIRFAKCILALTAGWLMAGCSAEDELGNGSATQQLSMTPMINDLQTTRVKEEENLHEKALSSLDFKMFGPTNNSDCRIDCQFKRPVENQAEVLASGDWKSEHHLDVNNTYHYYAVANAKEDLKGKNLKDLLASTQQDDDIWKTATMVNDKKFLMSSQGEDTITQDPEQNIPVELVRAAAKIKLNISSTVKDYHISDVQWKLINYNTNTTIFAGQTADPSIIPDNNTWSPAASAEDEKGNKVFTVTTYSYSTQWKTQETMPQIVAKVNFKYKDDSKKDTLKVLNIPVRDPQGDKKLDRNYIYTVNAVIKYLDTNTHIDYDGDTDYLKWQIAKWTQGEDTYVKGDKASFLVVYPTQVDLKDPMDWGTECWCIDWFASCPIDLPYQEKKVYYFDKNGNKKEDFNLASQINSQSDKNVSDNNRGKIDVHGNKPEYTIAYINFLVKAGSKSQKVNVRKYPAIYSLNVANAEASDKQNTQNRLYTLQFTTNQGIGGYTIAKPQLDSENKSTDKTVSPALIMASARHSNETAGSNEAARRYCQSYSEKATTLKGETLNMHGWRLPTTDEVKLIYQLANNNNVVDSQILSNAYYWTLDGTKAAFNGNGAQEVNSTYVRCVHDLTLEEIKKIENQGFE